MASHLLNMIIITVKMCTYFTNEMIMNNFLINNYYLVKAATWGHFVPDPGSLKEVWQFVVDDYLLYASWKTKMIK